jgi:SAM-dependent methyltransferase
MTFADHLLPLLRCQVCGGRFDFTPVVPPRFARAEFGILTCGCAKHPVVDGIPILQHGPVGMFEHTTGATQVEGVTPAELVRLIATGRGSEALVQCLAPAWRPRWFRVLEQRLSKLPKLARWRGRQEMEKVLANRDSRTARDILRFYFRRETLGPEVGDYFIHRFSQPRYLAALALTSNLTPSRKPVLDVGCGVGHLAHYLTRRRQPVKLIGVDMNFFQVWIAQHWVAPLARYACCNVADGLPFCSDSFSAVVVSDAYHYFPRRDQFNGEVDRVAPGRMIVLTRVGNRAVMPNEGSEVTLGEYLKELGGKPVQVFSEEGLVRGYLNDRNPLSRQGEEPGSLEHCKWLAFVCSAPAEAMKSRPQNEPCPHSVGRISLNPIYAQEIVGGTTKLGFRFPGTWYAYENHQMREYHPGRATLDSQDRKVLEAGGWNDSLERLLRQFVLIGLPDRY